MYFIDRSKIEETLLYMERLIQTLDQYSFTTFMEKLSLERITHMLIESTLDVGNMMIDGFIMRDPGSYEDIIDILADEKVIPEEEKENYKAIVRLRKSLVKEYITTDDEKIKAVMLEHKDVIAKYSVYVRAYLDNELGVVHAFSNEQ